MNFKINKGVLWLKVGYSLWAMATAMVMPFIALQMSSKGLSDGDISLILGVMPFSLVFIMPFIGKYRIIDSNKNVALVLCRNASDSYLILTILASCTYAKISLYRQPTQ